MIVMTTSNSTRVNAGLLPVDQAIGGLRGMNKVWPSLEKAPFSCSISSISDSGPGVKPR